MTRSNWYIATDNTTTQNFSNFRWQKALEVIESNNLSTIQEAHIALAILHASCQVHCNPRRKPRVLSTPKTQTPKRDKTLVSETEQSQPVSEQSKMIFFNFY